MKMISILSRCLRFCSCVLALMWIASLPAESRLDSFLPVPAFPPVALPESSPYLVLAQAAQPTATPAPPPPKLEPGPYAEAMIWVDATNGLWNGTRGRQDQPFSNLGRALAASRDGDVLFLRPGVYRREKWDHQLARSVSIVGSGMYNTTLLVTNVNLIPGQFYSALTSHLPTMTNAGTYLEVGNLTIDCNGANNRLSAGAKISGAYLVAESVLIEKVRVVGVVQETAEAFAVAANARRAIIRDCRVENTAKAYLTGIMGSGGYWGRVESLVLEGNTVDGMGAFPSVGLGLASAQNIHIRNNTVTNVTHGIMCDTGGITNAIIGGNIFHGDSAGRTTGGLYLAYFGSKDVTFEGNLVSGFKHGVLVTPQSATQSNANQQHLRTRIQDNTFLDCRTNIWAMNLINGRITGNRSNGGETAFARCQNIVFADNTLQTGGTMKGITNAFHSTPHGAVFDSQPMGFNRFPSRTPANANRPWFWLPVQINGTNAVIPIYR
jgi:hypothetical protein